MHKKMLVAVLLISLFFPAPLQILTGINNEMNYWTWIWSDKWFYLLSLLSMVFAYRIGKKFHWSLGLFTGYLLVSGLWAGMYSRAYAFQTGASLFELQNAALMATIAIAITAATLYHFNKQSYLYAGVVFGYVALLNSLIIIAQKLQHVQAGGLFGNPSISGCFLAIAYPVFRDSPIYVRAIVIAAVLATGTSQPVGVLAVVIVASVIMYKRRIIPVIAAAVLAMAAVVATVPIVTTKTNRSPFDDSGRFAVWKIAMEPWYKQGHYIVGQGTGTASALVPRLQMQRHAANMKVGESFRIDEYHWMHSDWLQILFENGIIGFTLSLIAAFFALVKARKNRKLFASVCGYFAAMCFNYPVHMPIHAFFGAILIGFSFHKGSEK